MLSHYNSMWARVKTLSKDEQKTWYRTINPCKGKIVNFYGILIIDIDLSEALEYILEESKA